MKDKGPNHLSFLSSLEESLELDETWHSCRGTGGCSSSLDGEGDQGKVQERVDSTTREFGSILIVWLTTIFSSCALCQVHPNLANGCRQEFRFWLKKRMDGTRVTLARYNLTLGAKLVTDQNVQSDG